MVKGVLQFSNVRRDLNSELFSKYVIPIAQAKLPRTHRGPYTRKDAELRGHILDEGLRDMEGGFKLHHLTKRGLFQLVLGLDRRVFRDCRLFNQPRWVNLRTFKLGELTIVSSPHFQ